MTDKVAPMSDDEVLAELPTIEQKAFLGNCSDISRNSFLKYVYRLPLGRVSMNYEVLSNRHGIRTTPFVRSVIAGYRRWLEEEWSTSSDVNGAFYNRAMEYINNDIV